MPSAPTPSDVHVNRPLTNMTVAFMQDQTNFVADRVFPPVPVDKASDMYWIWSREDMLRDEAVKVGPGAEAPITDLHLTKGTYSIDVYKLAATIADQERANQDDPIDLDAAKAADVTGKIWLKRERLFVASFFATNTWVGSTTGGDISGVAASPSTGQFVQWNDYATSNPVADIKAQVLALEKATGRNRRDFTLTVGPEVWAQLEEHPKFIERYEFTQPGIMSETLIAKVLGIRQVLVASGIVNTAAEGKPANMQFIFGKRALLTYSPSAPGVNVPSAGYTFAWKGLTGSTNGFRVKKYRVERNESDFIEAQLAVDMRVVAPVCGVLFDAAVA